VRPAGFRPDLRAGDPRLHVCRRVGHGGLEPLQLHVAGLPLHARHRAHRRSHRHDRRMPRGVRHRGGVGPSRPRPRQPRDPDGDVVHGPRRRLRGHRGAADPWSGIVRRTALMDEPPKNLKEMLSEAKDTSELMVDLAYAALYYNAIDIAEELGRLEDRLNGLVFDMRVLCLIAARSRRDAEEMASVLNVISAIDKIADAAIDIGNIVIRRLGIPSGLRADLGEAEEVVTRCRVHDDSTMDGTSLVD